MLALRQDHIYVFILRIKVRFVLYFQYFTKLLIKSESSAAAVQMWFVLQQFGCTKLLKFVVTLPSSALSVVCR